MLITAPVQAKGTFCLPHLADKTSPWLTLGLKSKVEKREDPPTSGLDFFKMAEEKRRSLWAQETLNFGPNQEVTHD